jgi:hypothetical protein
LRGPSFLPFSGFPQKTCQEEFSEKYVIFTCSKNTLKWAKGQEDAPHDEN